MKNKELLRKDILLSEGIKKTDWRNVYRNATFVYYLVVRILYSVPEATEHGHKFDEAARLAPPQA